MTSTMIESTTMLAQASGTAATGTVESPFGIVVVGFLFVVVVLALLSSVTALLGVFFTKQAASASERAAKAAQAAAESTGGSAAPSSGSAPPTSAPHVAEDETAITAVIAAAVHTVMGDRPHRVVSVRSSGPGWAQEGRRQIFSSHRVR